MQQPSRNAAKVSAQLRAKALKLPGTTEGIACGGTTLEKRTIQVGKKSFLFLSGTDAMLKLGESLSEATAIAASAGGSCKVGAHGWVTIKFGEAGTPPIKVLHSWVAESYRLMSPAKDQLAEKLMAIAPASKKVARKK